MESAFAMEHLMETASRMLDEGKNPNHIREHLLASGAPPEHIETVVKQVKTRIYLKRRKRGFILGAAGSLLLVIGFILTVVFYHSGVSIHVVMYSMTSLGAILLVAGMVDFIGW
jgi:hypothetical protein